MIPGHWALVHGECPIRGGGRSAVHVVVLAGARNDEIRGSGVYRAGVMVGGQTLLARTLAALSELPGLERLILVGPDDLIPPGCEVEVIIPGDDLLANLERGLSVLPEEEQVLVVASDLPLLTQAALRDFLAGCAARQAEVYYPIIRRDVYENAYPGSVRTYLSVRDGTFTGGNAALLTPAVLRRHRELFARAIACRKHPRKLSGLLGFGFSLGLMLKKYTVAEIESRVQARLGLKAAAIESRFSELGYDVDSPADLQWIEFYWGGAIEGAARRMPDLEEE